MTDYENSTHESAIKLSILIPAFNQAELLQATLQNLEQNLDSPLLVGLQKAIEILVSDNHSSDKTRSVALEYRDRIHYICQEENLGFLGNIDFLATWAAGEFVWFLGCGETLSSTRFLGTLLQVLDPATVRNVVITAGSPKSGESGETRFVTSEENSRSSSLFSESISGNVFNRKLYLRTMSASLIHGPWWPHIERALMIFNDTRLLGHRTLITTEAPLNIGISDSGWALDENSFLIPARELDILYRLGSPNTSLRSHRQRLGYIYVPLWILNQKSQNRFLLSREDSLQLSQLLTSCPALMRSLILLVTIIPDGLVRLVARCLGSVGLVFNRL